MSNEIDTIVNGDIDLYGFLELDSTSEENEIKRQYRRKALQYHPDKNPGEEAAKKFHLLSQIYEILSNDRLRSAYDKIRQIKVNKIEKLNLLSEQTRVFKEELERAEQESKFNNFGVFDNTNREFVERKVWENSLEKLKEEGLEKRRLQEKEIIQQSEQEHHKKYVSYKDIPPKLKRISVLEPGKSNITRVKTTIVKWKHKPELREAFTFDILQELMGIFGPVKSVEILPYKKNARYDAGIVEFEDFEGADSAVGHDYKKSAVLWDGTKVRKVASLLRECKYNSPTEQLDNDQETIIDIDAVKIRKLINKPNKLSSFDPPSKYSFRNVPLNSKTYMDQVLNKLILKEANDVTRI